MADTQADCRETLNLSYVFQFFRYISYSYLELTYLFNENRDVRVRSFTFHVLS